MKAQPVKLIYGHGYEPCAVNDATEAMRAVMQADESIHLRGTSNWAHRIARAVEAAVLAKVAAQAPAQQAEPVAWTLTETLRKRETTTRGHLWFSDPQNCMWTPLYTHPAPSHMAVMQQALDVMRDLVDCKSFGGVRSEAEVWADMYKAITALSAVMESPTPAAQQADIGIPASDPCCPKCKATSGNDWSHCIKPCPMGGPQE